MPRLDNPQPVVNTGPNELQQAETNKAAEKIVKPALSSIPFGDDRKILTDLSTKALAAKSQTQFDSATENMVALMSKHNVSQSKINEVLTLQKATFDSIDELKRQDRLDQASELLKGIASGQITAAQQILTQMSTWGYSDFARQEQLRIQQYEQIIQQLVSQFAQAFLSPELTALQALQSNQMAVPTIIASLQDFVEDMWGKVEEERKKEAEERRSARNREPVEMQEVKKEVEEVVRLTKNDFQEKGLVLDDVIRDNTFQELFREARAEQLRPLLMAGTVVPEKISPALSEQTTGPKDIVSRMDPIVQLALVRAYHTALDKYSRGIGKAG